MAVVNTLSLGLTNRDAQPSVKNNPAINGLVKDVIGLVTSVSGDSIASVYRFASVPSNARVSKVALFCGAMTGGAMDIGLYNTTENGGAVVSSAFFIAAQSMAAAQAGTDVTYSNLITLAKSEKMLWEVLGLASDPGIFYDICGTVTTAITTGAPMVVKAAFVS